MPTSATCDHLVTLMKEGCAGRSLRYECVDTSPSRLQHCAHLHRVRPLVDWHAACYSARSARTGGNVSLFDCRAPSDVTAQHIIDLVAEDVPEDTRLDYKQELPARGPSWKRSRNRDEARREFLNDVCAMANTSGGWLVYGVSEKKGPDKRPTGHPKAHLGVSDHHGLDSERLRLEDDVRRYITPRLSGFWVQTLRKRKEFPRGPIFVARVPSTWSGPFMVSYQDRTDFKGRGQGGNFAIGLRADPQRIHLGRHCASEGGAPAIGERDDHRQTRWVAGMATADGPVDSFAAGSADAAGRRPCGRRPGESASAHHASSAIASPRQSRWGPGAGPQSARTSRPQPGHGSGLLVRVRAGLSQWRHPGC